MYSYIKGSLVKVEKDSIIVENNGIGYKIFTSYTTMTEIEINSEVKIYTELIVRENDMFLVGFSKPAELSMFKQLLTVSGVGTKAGLAILSVADYTTIAMAIVSGDSKLLEKASGVGKKTAERIVVDLKDKVEKIHKSSDVILIKANGGSLTQVQSENNQKEELFEALQVLGYSKKEIEAVYKQIDIKDASIEKMILECLKRLG